MVLEARDYINSAFQNAPFFDYIRPEHIVQLQHARNREEALEEILALLHERKLIQEPKALFDALLTREQTVSTVLSTGFAIPHARLAQWPDFFLAIGMHQQGVPWTGPADEAVHLIFLIIGPDDKQTEYLRLIAYIAELIRDENTAKILLGIQSPKELFSMIKATTS